MNKGHAWIQKGEMVPQYFKNTNLVNDFLKSYKSNYSKSLSLLEKNVFLWCIENMIPYMQVRNKANCEILFYENLVLDIKDEWEKLEKFHLLRPGKNTLIKPSQQASIEAKKIGIKKEHQIAKWQNNFNNKQLHQINNILQLFNVNFYNAFDTMPIRKKTGK